MIFYYGHPAALYINKLRVAGLLQQPVNQYFEVIFETGLILTWSSILLVGLMLIPIPINHELNQNNLNAILNRLP